MVGRVRAYIGLGANVGLAPETMAAAIAALDALPAAHLTGVSRLYRTRPVGPVDQAWFYNAVAGLEVPLGPDPAAGALALLVALKGVEQALGRRQTERWGPREIDLDLLIFGRHRIRRERPDVARSADPARTGVQWLEVPHPAAHDRLFVLAPLEDLAPGLVPPGWGESVARAARRALSSEGEDSVQPVAAWDSGRRTWTRSRQPRGSTGSSKT